MNTPVLTTKRLTLRPISLGDAAFIQAEFPHWEIVRYMTDAVPWPYPPDSARYFIEHMALPEMQAGERHCWLISETETAQPIGVVDLMLSPQLFENRGFWVARSAQGKGYVTEAAAAVNDFAFNVLHLPVLKLGNAVANQASSRVKHTQGATLLDVRNFNFVAGTLPCEFWELTREGWLNSPYKRGALRLPKNAQELAMVHDLRRRVLFESKGRPTYNNQHPDDLNPVNKLMGFWREGELLGTVRLDPLGQEQVAVRLVAVEPNSQRGGVGREMMRQAHSMVTCLFNAKAAVLNAALDAVGFYEKLGYGFGVWADPSTPIDAAAQKQMLKTLA